MSKRIVVVTGGASGIGREIVLAFGREGDKVYAIDLNQTRLQETLSLAEKDGSDVHTVQADVTNQTAIDDWVAKIIAESSTIDILINNAGVMDAFTPLLDVTDELWDKVIGTNLTAVFKVTRAVLPIFVAKQSGQIINIVSVAGLNSFGGGTSYVTAKHGLIGLTKQIASFYRQFGIKVNAIAPGAIESNLRESYGWERHRKGFEHILSHRTHHALSREGQASEIATVAIFLASSNASFINGSVITVDNGDSV